MRIIGYGRPWSDSPYRPRTPGLVPPRWSFVLDSPYWGEGREYGAPFRINMWTPWGWLGVALSPGSRFVGSWNPFFHHYFDVVHWIHWVPR